LIVDFRRQRKEHATIHINGTAVEKVSSFNLLKPGGTIFMFGKITFPK
jgi:hypothetical protein